MSYLRITEVSGFGFIGSNEGLFARDQKRLAVLVFRVLECAEVARLGLKIY